MKWNHLILILFLSVTLFGQADDVVSVTPKDLLPYQEIPEYPETYTATNVLSRMIDGLGFRYYWATEDLREEDLTYKFSESSRTSKETIYHIYGLVEVIHSSVNGRASIRPLPELKMSFAQMRSETLRMLKETSDILRGTPDTKLEQLKIVFKRGEKESEFPFWHQMNGPLSDALWHVGQVVSSRRASGNPFDFRANVFMGKRRNQ